MAERIVTDHPLHVSPEVRGLALASPFRRAAGLLIDCAILVVPTVALALAAAMLSLQLQDPEAARAIRNSFGRHHRSAVETAEMWRALLPTLVEHEAAGLPAAAVDRYEKGDMAGAIRELNGYNLLFVLKLGEGAAQPVKPHTVRLQLEDLIPPGIRVIALFGVPAAYFTLFLVFAHGRTPGKRLTRTRVVRLDGHPLTFLEALERFVGYVHIPLTAGVSIFDLWRDPNRRMPHDRTVHTVVVRDRAKSRA